MNHFDTTPYMISLIQETPGITATKLAEDTAIFFNHPEWLDQETHSIWDLAADIVENYGANQ
jgi:hypothetical protein